MDFFMFPDSFFSPESHEDILNLVLFFAGLAAYFVHGTWIAVSEFRHGSLGIPEFGAFLFVFLGVPALFGLGAAIQNDEPLRLFRVLLVMSVVGVLLLIILAASGIFHAARSLLRRALSRTR